MIILKTESESDPHLRQTCYTSCLHWPRYFVPYKSRKEHCGVKQNSKRSKTTRRRAGLQSSQDVGHLSWESGYKRWTHAQHPHGGRKAYTASAPGSHASGTLGREEYQKTTVQGEESRRRNGQQEEEDKTRYAAPEDSRRSEDNWHTGYKAKGGIPCNYGLS